MNTFTLHPVLAADCHVLGPWRNLHLLLHRDSHVRWLILVPETDAAEWHEVSAPLRDQLLAASSLLGAMLKDDEGCDKINVAAIGNLVPQFHYHVVGRWRTDPYWPGVVWGRSVAGHGYGDGDVRRIAARVMSRLGQGAA